MTALHDQDLARSHNSVENLLPHQEIQLQLVARVPITPTISQCRGSIIIAILVVPTLDDLAITVLTSISP